MTEPAPTTVKHEPWTGLVLSGGGARGAYEAGIIRYIREELPERVRQRARFEIVSGTSVGALNACFLAAHAHVPDMQGAQLCELWESLRIERVYSVGWRELLNLPRFVLGSGGFGELDDRIGPGRRGGLFHTGPLEALVRHGNRWGMISRNINAGRLEALTVTATDIGTGKTVVFVERRGGGVPPWSRDPWVTARPTRITHQHALASAAIPWLFPAVEVEGRTYCDGGLRHNTPLSPPLRLGADRVLVIGLRHEESVDEIKRMESERVDSFPSAAYLLGKILNALLLDHTEYDIERLERTNALVEGGRKVYGPEFAEKISKVMGPRHAGAYRVIKPMVIKPTTNIGVIAAKHARLGSAAARVGGIVGRLIRRIGEDESLTENDLLSYLLFDGEYAHDLVELGMHDADAARSRLIEFFTS
ncbi:MAG: patatin-like phospholipase family protein [Deltaproteobacteria bacterium]|nr:patatin-like phospholipase family protein [Deltaproteobacteria bacterium]